MAAAPILPPPPAPGRVLVGFSGGLDSTVLLHLLAADDAMRRRGLRAIHVHHGLAADADAWAAHCRQVCDGLGLALEVARVEVDRGSGLGLEAAARQARYDAFQSRLADGEILALAHHLDDQAETFLLRALRGSGVDGLAAMRPWRRLGRGWLWRPLLDLPRERLLDHARAQGLSWVEDPANASTSHDRTFLRLHLLPLLRQRWPHAARSLARSAALAGEAAGLLEAADNQALAAVGSGGPDVLPVAWLLEHPPARRARLLRLWTRRLGLPPLPAAGVARIEADLLAAPGDGAAEFAWAGALVRHWRGHLYAGWPAPPLPRAYRAQWDGRAPLRLPTGDLLAIEAATPGSLPPARGPWPVWVHARRGGERIVLPGRSHSHALKHVLQDRGVPPWVRERLPLLSSADGCVLAAGDQVISGAFDHFLRQAGARLCWSPADPE